MTYLQLQILGKNKAPEKTKAPGSFASRVLETESEKLIYSPVILQAAVFTNVPT
jgi:hypothetical protein